MAAKNNTTKEYYTTNTGSDPWANYNVVNSLYKGPAPTLTVPPTFTPDNNMWQPNDIPGYDYCWNRLPCGICRLTNSPCPKQSSTQPDVTWLTRTDTTMQEPLEHLQTKSYTYSTSNTINKATNINIKGE